VASFSVLFAIIFVSLTLSLHLYLGTRLRNDREAVMARLMLVRARLEREVYARIATENGMARLFELDPALTAAEFSRYAGLLVHGDPVVRNIGILKDTTIVMAYPYEANKASIGRDIALVPEQRGALLRARDEDRIVVTGPVNLVQGGRGLVARMPIHGFGMDGTASYWGQVGVVLDLDNLFGAAETFSDASLKLAIRDGDVNGTPIIAGNAETFLDTPVVMPVSVPDSSWEIAAEPAEGWNARIPQYVASGFASFVIAAFIAFLVSSLVAARYRMKNLAYYDTLTGLPNRKMFWDRFNLSAAFASRRQLRIALFMLDLDGFKAVNDRYGHASGDRLLCAVAERLTGNLRGDDTVARLGGDEFALHTIMETGDDTVRRLSERIEGVFAEPFLEPEPGTRVKVSYGFSVWPDEGQTGDAALETADSRMYEMKRRRGHRR